MPEGPKAGERQRSALVILRPADPVTASEPITSTTVARHAPSPEAVTGLMAFFRSSGFDVGPFAGVSFSISGPVSSFRSVFGPDLPSGDHDRLELDAGSLPPALRPHVEAVSFSAPLEFGPGAP